ncbi:MAG: DUF5679 domain-containing protein [Dehalococcoidia bacterium]|nr:hypothetical protein [Chloroflexota bacterium]
MQAYCMKCREKVEIKNPKAITMKSGRPATQGECPGCGTKVYRMQVLEAGEVSITKEANYIINQAENYDPRLVTHGPLIFFSTETGDAWMLDPEDELALCLARDGEEQPFTITETPTDFSIEWNAEYRIDGDAFIVIERPGRIKTIFGYPTAEILQAIRRAR